MFSNKCTSHFVNILWTLLLWVGASSVGIFLAAAQESGSQNPTNTTTSFGYLFLINPRSSAPNATVLYDTGRQQRTVLKPLQDVGALARKNGELEHIPDQLPVESNIPLVYSAVPYQPGPYHMPDPHYGATNGIQQYNYLSAPPPLTMPVLPNVGVAPMSYPIQPMTPYVPSTSPAFTQSTYSAQPSPMKTEVVFVKADGDEDAGDSYDNIVAIRHNIPYDPTEASDDHEEEYSKKKLKPDPEYPVVESHSGWNGPEKNPILATKEIMYDLWEHMKDFSVTDMLLWAEKGLSMISELAIPWDHYMQVLGIAGIYLFFAALLYGKTRDLTCSVDPNSGPLRQYGYHAGRRFVPARTVSTQIQDEFIDMFYGVEDGDKDSSDELDSYVGVVLDEISKMCSKDSFFYSMSPMHTQAVALLQRLFIDQHTPSHVLSLSKALLYSDKIHPKVWYLGLLGAAMTRPDMIGFSMAHPIDAIPDWFIPAHLISDVMNSYKRRSIRVKRGLFDDLIMPFKNFTRTKKGSRRKKKSKPITTTISPPKRKLKYYNRGTTISSTEDVTTTVATTEATSPTTTTTEKPKRSQIPKVASTTTPKTTKAPVIVLKGDSGINASRLASLLNVQKAESLEDDGPYRNASYSKLHYEFVFDEDFPEEYDDQQNQTKGKRRQKKKGRPSKKKKRTRKKKRNRKKKKKKRKNKKKGNDDDCIVVDWNVGEDNGIENRLWYYREDIILNQHHFYWHLANPPNSTMHADRRAELFFYMHRGFNARYNAERLSNGLSMVGSFQIRPGASIPDGYNSHLADVNSGVFWTPRPRDAELDNIFHEHDPDFARNVTFSQYLTAYGRLVQSVLRGKLITMRRRPVPISNSGGIELLANAAEASDISVNPMFYDPTGVHNLGHIMIGLIADPDFRFGKVSGVMGEVVTSMRDPVFYPYHLFIDDLFELHKRRLPPYQVVGGEFPLLWQGVDLVKVELLSQGGPPVNELRTFWARHKFRLSPGVDRSIEEGVEHAKVCATHLDHEPFTIKITIDRLDCVRSKSGKGTVRIFMAPRFNEKGVRIPLKKQRRMLFPLDAFPVKLKVGRNVITRYAEDSSLTQPWTKSLKDFKRGPDSSGSADFCGCGWPQHLLLPKGTAKGMTFDMFAMVTNYDMDYVPNDVKVLDIPETCNSPYIYCGIPRRRYPDARPMGYPFDRPIFKRFSCPFRNTIFGNVLCKYMNFNMDIYSLEEYASRASNMAALQVTIKHLNTLFPEPARH